MAATGHKQKNALDMDLNSLSKAAKKDPIVKNNTDEYKTLFKMNKIR